MLANLHNIFSPQAIVQTLSILPPMETTVMDTYFKNRPTHPLPLIGVAELVQKTQTVPLVRRDGSPISLSGQSYEAQFIAPLPVKTQTNVSASELNDLRAMMQSPQAIEAWRRSKIEYLRNTARNTTEAICTVVLNQGKVSWPVQLEGGNKEVYEVDYGAIHAYEAKTPLTPNSKVSEVYRLLRGMAKTISQSGIGGRISFMAGSDVADVLIDMAERSTTTQEKKPVRIELGEGKTTIGKYVVEFMDEMYPDPLSDEWLPKLSPKAIMAVATDQQGTIYYCAIDSISVNNAAMPMHIIPVARTDDTGYTLISQTKPLPARASKGTCICVAVA